MADSLIIGQGAKILIELPDIALHTFSLIRANDCVIASATKFGHGGTGMGIRKTAMGLAAVALLGTSPLIAAAPVMPSVAQISLAPVAGTNLSTAARMGVHARRSSNLAGGGLIIGVLAAAAVAGGVVAATDNGNGHSSSP
jgi:hypothetical protein